MSKCDLLIELDKPDRRFVIGERITGVVQVRVNKECTCKKLTIDLGWQTHGKGNIARGSASSIILFEGVWQPGELLSYSFEITAPPGPLTYHGNILNVDWYLDARADIPWAFDPKTKTDLLLEIGDYDGRLNLGPSHKDLGDQLEASKKATGCGLRCGVIILILGLLGLTAGLLSGIGIMDDDFFGVGLIAGGIATFIGGILILSMMWTYIAQKKLGPVSVSFTHGEVAPGMALGCSIQFQPRDNVEIEWIRFSLKGEEVVVYGSGSNRRTYRHALCDSTVDAAQGQHLTPGEQVEYKQELSVPHDAAGTFAASDNSVTWKVTAHISIPGWPDWKRTFPLVVRPVPGP